MLHRKFSFLTIANYPNTNMVSYNANDSTTSAIMNVCYSHGGTDVHNSDCE